MAKHEKAKIDDRKRQLRLLQNPKLSNVQFVLDNDGAAVSANNGILSLKCEYFDAMFRGECTKVARNRLLLILSLSPCLMWSDRRLWQCWNGCTAKQPTAENCLGVLALASQWLLPHLFDVCAEWPYALLTRPTPCRLSGSGYPSSLPSRTIHPPCVFTGKLHAASR